MLYILNILLRCRSVFFFRALCSGAPSGTQGARPNSTALMRALSEVRARAHMLWGFKVASNHGEAFQAHRAIQAHANPRTRYRLKKMSEAHRVISKIVNVDNVVSHYFVVGMYFPDTNLRGMRPLLVH